jgi:hypothetical protein
MDIRGFVFVAASLALAGCRAPQDEDDGEGVLESAPMSPGGAAKPGTQPVEGDSTEDGVDTDGR